MSAVEQLVDGVMRWSPFVPLSRQRVDLVVLAYHGVDDRSRFAGHLDHLVARYTPVDLDQALDGIHGAALPDRAALITFDDGERTVLTNGLPELEARGLPSVLFQVAGVVDTTDPFWWVEAAGLASRGRRADGVPGEVWAGGSDSLVRYLKGVRDSERRRVLQELRDDLPTESPQLTSDEVRHLDRSGMRVENHSLTHPLLDMCDDETIEREIAAAHSLLQHILGRPPEVFAYPNGNTDDRVVAALQRHGYRAAFLFDHRTAQVPAADPLRVSRVRVNSTTTQNRFATIVSGVHPAVHRMRGGA